MIGIRLSLHPMRDDFAPLILDALRGLSEFGVSVETDDVTTCLLGEEPNLWESVRVAFARAVRSGAHVVLNATASAGCPGEPDEDVCVPRSHDGPRGGEEGWSREAFDIGPVSAQFALYPLGVADYMGTIVAEIAHARQGGLRVVGRHFCTHLYGSGDDVFAAFRQAFDRAQQHATHVVMTLTVSANSPSATAQPRDAGTLATAGREVVA